jgi:poly(3-hydroxybutyrate) depolymerase
MAIRRVSTLGTPATATVTINDNDVANGPCGASGNAWAGNAGNYVCSGSCSPTPSPQTLSVNGDIVTINPHHAGGAATFQGCTSSLVSQSKTLTYFSQSNHTNTITRSSNTSFSTNVVSSGGGSCTFSCSR